MNVNRKFILRFNQCMDTQVETCIPSICSLVEASTQIGSRHKGRMCWRGVGGIEYNFIRSRQPAEWDILWGLSSEIMWYLSVTIFHLSPSSMITWDPEHLSPVEPTLSHLSFSFATLIGVFETLIWRPPPRYMVQGSMLHSEPLQYNSHCEYTHTSTEVDVAVYSVDDHLAECRSIALVHVPFPTMRNLANFI